MRQEVIQKAPEQAKKQTPNLTGIPTQMKLDFERRSGLSFDDVRVHYNSDKPRKIGALAYTQIPQVHIGPGQERHLRHELGHVVQQKQGIVRPTTWINGLPVNNSPGLERSASQSMFSALPTVMSGGIGNTYNAVQMIAENRPDDAPLFVGSGPSAKFIDNEQRLLIKSIQVEKSAEDKRPEEKSGTQVDSEMSEVPPEATNAHSSEKEVHSAKIERLVLNCEKIVLGKPDTSEVHNIIDNADNLFRIIETGFDNQFQWIVKYYNAVMAQLPPIPPKKKDSKIVELSDELLQELQWAAIVSSSNLGEDAYTFFKKQTEADHPTISKLYFAAKGDGKLKLTLNKARIYTGLIQEWVNGKVKKSATHAADSGKRVAVIKPNTSLTSQLLSPCIAMISIPGQRPIKCLNSATFLKRKTDSTISYEDYARMTQFEPERNEGSIRIGLLPKYISPQIGKRLRALSVADLAAYTVTAGAGTHAEVRAVNKYFKTYGKDIHPGSQPAPVIDLRIAKSNKRVTESPLSLMEFAKCPHCAAILDADQLGVQWVPGTDRPASAVSAETTGIAVSAKKSIQDAVCELGFEIVDRRQSATPPGPDPGPDSGMKKPR